MSKTVFDINRVFSVGDLSQGSHLFPFRTEKLSLVEPMIVFMAKVGSRQHRVLDSKKILRVALDIFWDFIF